MRYMMKYPIRNLMFEILLQKYKLKGYTNQPFSAQNGTETLSFVKLVSAFPQCIFFVASALLHFDAAQIKL